MVKFMEDGQNQYSSLQLRFLIFKNNSHICSNTMSLHSLLIADSGKMHFWKGKAT